ncbi:MAG: PIN domain-containing protein [Candidatus Njordarchaeia archaeon]
MRYLYADTNLIIARYKPKDHLYDIANKIFNLDQYKIVISPISLVELFSVLSRVKNHIKIPPSIRGFDLSTLIKFIVDDCNIALISETYIIETNVLAAEIKLPLEYYIAFSLAERIKLRTLDLLHIAYTYILKNKIDAFVTGDKEILQKKEQILNELQIKVLSPEEIIS